MKPSQKIKMTPEFRMLRTLAPAAKVLSEVVRAESVRLARQNRSRTSVGYLKAIADVLGISPDHVSRRSAGDDPADETVTTASTGCGPVTDVTVHDSSNTVTKTRYTLATDQGPRTYEITVRDITDG